MLSLRGALALKPTLQQPAAAGRASFLQTRTQAFSAIAQEYTAALDRSYLYGKLQVKYGCRLFLLLIQCLVVPTSSDRMLEKSLSTKSDVIIYDLEDSVPPSASDKNGARSRLQKFMAVRSSHL